MKPKISVPPVLKDPRSKPEFPDDISKLEHVSPLIATSIEFDWEVLQRLLDEGKGDVTETDWSTLADILQELLRWMVKGDDLHKVGRRTIALAWSINPDLFRGSPSASVLARMMGCSVDLLHRETGEARRSFGLKNRLSDHAWNFRSELPSKEPNSVSRANPDN